MSYIIVTHNIEEAVILGKKIAIMIDGEIKEIINLDEKAKQSILDDYYKFTKDYHVSNKKINAIEPIRLNAKVYNDNGVSYEDGKYIESYVEENSEITLVAIDEGEGFVIDYIVVSSDEKR